MPAPKSKPVTIVRDSRTGLFVRRQEAIRRPSSTETEVVRRPAPKRK